MARENQGLKGALIVFVLLTIVFAVVTVILFSKQSELRQQAEKDHNQATQDAKAARTAITEMESLKTMMGFDPTAKLKEDIEKGFNEDMKLYAASYLNEPRDYRQALRRLSTVISEKNVDLENRIKENALLAARCTNRDTATENEVKQFADAATAAKTDLKTESDKFAADRKRIENQQQSLSSQRDKLQDERSQLIAKSNEDLSTVNKKLDAALSTNKVIKGQMDDLKREKPDVFLGSISWVNQRSGMVWINLGRADALRPQTSFSVYNTDTSETSEVTKKASIKVTQILGEHLAEAKILQDKSTDPILPGDKIFTPIWSVGEKQRFSLAGVVDLDKDGKDDRARLYALIELNGGIVDAPIDENGKRQGHMTLNTRYLILGETPGITSSPELLKDYTEATREAAQLNVETISLRAFLEMVGWKHESKVVDHNGSNADDFSVERDKSPATSPGTISELFKPRRPPRAHNGSTF